MAGDEPPDEELLNYKGTTVFSWPTDSRSGPGVLAGSYSLTGVAIPAHGADITPATAARCTLLLACDAGLGFACNDARPQTSERRKTQD
jgi:hypothetical protein